VEGIFGNLKKEGMEYGKSHGIFQVVSLVFMAGKWRFGDFDCHRNHSVDVRTNGLGEKKQRVLSVCMVPANYSEHPLCVFFGCRLV
jgi:hypothetical protein